MYHSTAEEGPPREGQQQGRQGEEGQADEAQGEAVIFLSRVYAPTLERSTGFGELGRQRVGTRCAQTEKSSARGECCSECSRVFFGGWFIFPG